MTILYVISALIGIIITFLFVTMEFIIRNYIIQRKTDKLVLRLYSSSPRRFAYFSAICTGIGVALVCSAMALVAYTFIGNDIFVASIILLFIAAPLLSWGVFRNINKISANPLMKFNEKGEG